MIWDTKNSEGMMLVDANGTRVPFAYEFNEATSEVKMYVTGTKEGKPKVLVTEGKPLTVSVNMPGARMIPREDSKPLEDPVQRENAQNELARSYFHGVLELAYEDGVQEFNFMKKAITTPIGGVYLMQIQHVTGPKIDLPSIFGPDLEKEKTS